MAPGLRTAGPARHPLPSLVRWATLALLLWLGLGLLGGCALWRQDRPAAAPDDEVPLVAVVRLVVEAPAPLKALLERHLDLARLQALPAGETLSAPEWARLVASAPAQARELLQTEGYFEAVVQVQREALPGDGSLTAVPGATALPVLRVIVTPGPQVRVHRLQVRADGVVALRAEQGDREASLLRDRLGTAATLQPGRPFRNPAWAESKQQVLARLRAAGYATASLADSQADIDVAGQQADLRIQADSGPLFVAGEVQVSGLRHHEASTVRHLAGFDKGAPLTEARLLDYQERLRRAGLFQSASVSFEPDPAHANAAPVQVRLTELPLQQATVGVGISANTGPRVTLEHTHRRPFDQPIVAYDKLEWGRDLQGWTGDFQTHPRAGFYRNLLGVKIERVLSSTDVVLSQRLRLGRTQDTPSQERLAFVELLHSRKNELGGTGLAVTAATALTANLHLVWRRLDSVLLPTDGQTLSLQGALGHATSRTGPDGPVGVLYGRVTAYRPLGQRWYGQARLEAGQVFKRAAVDYPDALGFRAGGDESVRGYAYRELAPTDATGRTVSGSHLLTASVELARPVRDDLPQVWGAVFVDAGRAADSWRGLRPALGYGVGVRWRSPIGPLRLDLARGHALQRWRLHLSVGIAF
jgi:translocation and assembly module TamA